MGAKCYSLNVTFQEDDSIYFTVVEWQYSGLSVVKRF